MRNHKNEWLPLDDFAEMPYFKNLGWSKSAMIGAAKCGFIQARFCSKIKSWTTTLDNLKDGIFVRNHALERQMRDPDSLDSL